MAAQGFDRYFHSATIPAALTERFGEAASGFDVFGVGGIVRGPERHLGEHVFAAYGGASGGDILAAGLGALFAAAQRGASAKPARQHHRYSACHQPAH
jgi:hypothetical protein